MTTSRAPKPPALNELFTIPEIARLLDRTHFVIYSHVKNLGGSEKRGGHYLVPRAVVLDIVRNRLRIKESENRADILARVQAAEPK